VSPTKDEDSDEAPVLDDAALDRIDALPGVVVACPDFRVSGVEITFDEQSTTAMAVGLPRQMPLVAILKGSRSPATTSGRGTRRKAS
jgi:hypothetical protein